MRTPGTAVPDALTGYCGGTKPTPKTPGLSGTAPRCVAAVAGGVPFRTSRPKCRTSRRFRGRTGGIARARRSPCTPPWLPGSTRPSRGKKGRGPLPSSWQNVARSAFGCPSGARSFRPACARLARYQSPAAPLTRGFVGGVPSKLPPEPRNIPSWSAWWHPCNYALRNYMGVIFSHRGQIRKRRFLILGSPAGLARRSGQPTLR